MVIQLRKLATAAFSFATAILLSRYILPYGWLPVCGAVSVTVSLAGMLFRGNARLRIFIALLSLAAGFTWSWAFTAIYVAPSQRLHGESAEVKAVVTDYPSARSARGYRVDVTILLDDGPDVGARLYYYNNITLEPGDIIEFTANFRRTEGTDAQERIDALSSRGAFLTGYVSGELKLSGSEGGLSYLPKKAAEAIAKKIGELYPGDVSHFMQALLVGKRDSLFRDDSLSAALSASGIIHIVSISGMHVSFLMGFLALIVRNKRRFAMIGIPVLLFFMAMTGFTPSVTRAGIMQIFLICAPIFKRESDSITSLSAALTVLLAANPYSCASVGLQLSFSATLGIILFTGRICSAVSDALRDVRLYKKKVPRAMIGFVTSSLATTTGALILTIPLTALHFGYVSLIAPVTNLLTLLVVSMAFPLGFISALLGFIFQPLGAIIAWPVTQAARYIIFAARTLAAVPYSVVYTSNSLIMFWLAYIYVMFISLPLLKARPRQYIAPAGISFVLLFALFLLSPLLPGSKDTSITVLDVGQGLSVVVTSGDHSAMVDCGSASGENAGAIAHEFLQRKGKISLDLLILTHFHEDHTNGVQYLLSRIGVSAIVLPNPEGSFIAEDIIELARKRGTDIIYVTETLSVSLGGFDLIVYPPLESGSENECGLSVLVTGDIRALITGDMNSSGERSLLRFADIPDIDLLVVGHHGSRHSTSEELLRAVSPEIAVIPVGRNSYGHPAGETLGRLDLYSVTVYQTDITGHVTVNAGP